MTEMIETPVKTEEQTAMTGEKPWYMEWFDENYLDVYRHRNTDDARRQVRLVTGTLNPGPRDTILDLGCGEGRYTLLFKNKGYRIFGLDLSRTLVQVGKKNHPQLDLMVGDMRQIPGRFHIILSLFTSFGYFDTDEENARVLRSVYDSLHPGGVYWLDFLNPCFVSRNLVPRSHTRLHDHIEVVETRRIMGGRIVKDIHFQGGDKKKSYRESVRLFTREELENMFVSAGFRIIDGFGDYNGHKWSKRSERTILVGKKAEKK